MAASGAGSRDGREEGGEQEGEEGEDIICKVNGWVEVFTYEHGCILEV